MDAHHWRETLPPMFEKMLVNSVLNRPALYVEKSSTLKRGQTSFLHNYPAQLFNL